MHHADDFPEDLNAIEWVTEHAPVQPDSGFEWINARLERFGAVEDFAV
jgi:hypothetical protein